MVFIVSVNWHIVAVVRTFNLLALSQAHIARATRSFNCFVSNSFTTSLNTKSKEKNVNFFES